MPVYTPITIHTEDILEFEYDINYVRLGINMLIGGGSYRIYRIDLSRISEFGRNCLDLHVGDIAIFGLKTSTFRIIDDDNGRAYQCGIFHIKGVNKLFMVFMTVELYEFTPIQTETYEICKTRFGRSYLKFYDTATFYERLKKVYML